MEIRPTIFLVDNDPPTRSVVCGLSALMGMRVELFGSGEEFLDAYETSRPGCALLEVHTLGLGGLQVQRDLLSGGAMLPVIFLAARASVSIAVQAMRNGAIDFLEKPVRDQDLWETIQKAIRLDKARRLLHARQERLDRQIGKLSKAQYELMHRIADGQTSREIAALWGVCTRTIENRRAQLMDTLEVNSMRELLYIAVYVRSRRAYYGGDEVSPHTLSGLGCTQGWR